MARKPNYDFERRERDRLKQIKNAARADAKLKAKEGEATDAPEATTGDDPVREE